MMKRFLVVALTGLTLAGCTNDSTLSGDVYSSSQAKQVQSVSYGTLVAVRPVQIQDDNNQNIIGTLGGAVIGGFLGNTVGGGTGRSLATAAGAIAGGVAGQGIESGLSRSNAVELHIRKDDGNTIIVVQKTGKSQYSVGQRVTLATSGSSVTVAPSV